MTDDTRTQITELADRARQVRLEALELPARARNLLKSKGISNTYEAMLYIVDHLAAEKGIGPKTLAEARSATRDFLAKLESLDQEARDTLNDPRVELSGAAEGNLVEAFPGVVELYHSRRSGHYRARNLDIIRKRFGLDGSTVYTLDELGTYYDVSRVRIQQVEARTVRELGLLFSGCLNTKGWRLSARLIASYLEFRARLATSAVLITRPELDLTLGRSHGSTLNPGYLNLLMETCGYIKLPSRIAGFRGVIVDSWRERSRRKTKDVEAIFRSLNAVFDSPEPHSIFDLAIAAKKRSISRISNEDIESAIEAVVDFERKADQVIVRFSHLRGAAHKAFRVLREHQKPMHYSKIAALVNSLSHESPSFRPINEKTLANQMGTDSRFVPIGRSGEWGLSTWTEVKNVTIVEAIQLILHKAGKPLKHSVLLDAVKAIRPASAKSVRLYLNDPSLFTRVSPGVFGLRSWRLVSEVRGPRESPVPENVFAAALKSALALQNPISLHEAVAVISDKTKLAEATVRGRLSRLDAVEMRYGENAGQQELYCEDVSSLTAQATSHRKLLRERVQEEVRSVLYEQPNEPMRKGELFSLVSKKVDCIRPTFYRYLQAMEDIHQYREGHEFFAVYKIEEGEPTIRLNLEQYCPSQEMAAQLSRPMSKLTLEEIDIALYEFGLQFENALRRYLVALRSKQQGKVLRRDLAKLKNMVDWVAKEGIVSRTYHLEILREERNNRAHGEVPSKAERVALFNKAHYVADLFIKYICWFDNEARRI